uniref:Small integral membrane protein 4 n=1 Tax=Terrapene triunguis TaxID=2587831 RepID=A0A674JVQ7_9SAUR
MLVRRKIRYFLQLVPGRHRFGMYRFLPFFFLLGGAMEWFMINVRLGEETFCKWQEICQYQGSNPVY